MGQNRTASIGSIRTIEQVTIEGMTIQSIAELIHFRRPGARHHPNGSAASGASQMIALAPMSRQPARTAAHDATIHATRPQRSIKDAPPSSARSAVARSQVASVHGPAARQAPAATATGGDASQNQNAHAATTPPGSRDAHMPTEAAVPGVAVPADVRRLAPTNSARATSVMP